MTTTWTDLTTPALLGTGRGLPLFDLPGRLNALLADAEAETRLLRVAGILMMADQAALTVSPADEPEPAPAPPEVATVVTEPRLIALLTRILGEGRTRLLIEACGLLAETGRCLPPRLLPAALELGRQLGAVRDPLRRVLGRRGAWLAAQHPDWRFAALAGIDPDERQIWDEGDAEQRATFLRRLRAADPAEGRQLLESAFADELARTRAILLPALAEQLRPDDEPFLAEVLAKDRGKEVRQIAAVLLSRLPASAFAQRMSARLDSCIRSERKLLRTVTVIEPPASFVADWKTDGLEESPPPGAKFGERAWWLRQIVSYTPLVWWEQRLALQPVEILATVAKSEWKGALLGGFRTALGQQPGHHAWTLALLERGGFTHQQAVPLALTLSPAEADTALQRILTATDDAALAAQIIESADFGWSAALWHLVEQKLPLWLAQQNWQFRHSLPLLAGRIPPVALMTELTAPELTPFADAFTEFSAILHQRRSLYRILGLLPSGSASSPPTP